MEAANTVGILGGMGPMATVEFFRRLVAATPANVDQEHLHVLIDSDPSVPNRTAAILHEGPSPVPWLSAMARRLEAAGAGFLVMPCNTAHVYLDAIRASVSIPVVDMIVETVAALDRSPVGLLATDGTVRSGLYQRAAAARGIAVVVPTPAEQRSAADAIERIKRGEDPGRVRDVFAAIARRLGREGAAAVVAGCTEISLVSGSGMDVPWIDALDCLVEATLRDARGGAGRTAGKEAE